MLPQVYTLPYPESAATATNGYGDTRLGKHGSNMRWHIVRTLLAVNEPTVAVGHEIAHESFEVAPHIRVRILAHDE